LRQDNRYPYAQGDLLERPNTYFYTPFAGHDLLRAWAESREAVLAHIRPGKPAELADSSTKLSVPPCVTATLLERLTEDFSDGNAPPHARITLLDRLVQRFEVSKRVYTAYDRSIRAVRDSGYERLDLYLMFGEVLVLAFRRAENLTYLNCLLKVTDTLIAMQDRLPASLHGRLERLIMQERDAVQVIADQREVTLTC